MLEGQILNVAATRNQGIVLGDDGLRYTFTVHDWGNNSVRAVPGMRVEFTARDSFATDIRVVHGATYSATSAPASPSMSSSRSSEIPRTQHASEVTAHSTHLSPVQSRRRRPAQLKRKSSGSYESTNDAFLPSGVVATIVLVLLFWPVIGLMCTVPSGDEVAATGWMVLWVGNMVFWFIIGLVAGILRLLVRLGKGSDGR